MVEKLQRYMQLPGVWGGNWKTLSFINVLYKVVVELGEDSQVHIWMDFILRYRKSDVCVWFPTSTYLTHKSLLKETEFRLRISHYTL